MIDPVVEDPADGSIDLGFQDEMDDSWHVADSAFGKMIASDSRPHQVILFGSSAICSRIVADHNGALAAARAVPAAPREASS